MLFLNNIKKGNTWVKVLKKKKKNDYYFVRVEHKVSILIQIPKKYLLLLDFFFQVNQVRFVKIAQCLRSLKKKKNSSTAEHWLANIRNWNQCQKCHWSCNSSREKKTRNVIINNFIFEATVKSILKRKPKYLPEFFSTSVKTNKKKKQSRKFTVGRAPSECVSESLDVYITRASTTITRIASSWFRFYLYRLLVVRFFSFSRRLFHNRHSARRRKAPYSG